MKRTIIITLTFLAINAITPLFAQNTKAADNSTDLLTLLVNGGWAMVPLTLTALAMFFLTFFCFMETASTKFIPEAILGDLKQNLSLRNISAATKALGSSPCVLSRTLVLALSKAKPDWPDANKDKVETTFIEALEAEDSAIGATINYLNVVAAVAPMIGLLGTVSGMIGAFQTIGIAGLGDPSALAGDIGEALTTTATGLVIGIPAMVFYFFFKNRLAARMVNVAQSGSNLIDDLVGDYIASSYEEGHSEDQSGQIL